jgi:hypothetical protein
VNVIEKVCNSDPGGNSIPRELDYHGGGDSILRVFGKANIYGKSVWAVKLCLLRDRTALTYCSGVCLSLKAVFTDAGEASAGISSYQMIWVELRAG